MAMILMQCVADENQAQVPPQTLAYSSSLEIESIRKRFVENEEFFCGYCQLTGLSLNFLLVQQCQNKLKFSSSCEPFPMPTPNMTRCI